MLKIPFKIPLLASAIFAGSLFFAGPAPAGDWGFSIGPYGTGFHYGDSHHGRHHWRGHHWRGDHHYRPYRYYAPRYHHYQYPGYYSYPGGYSPGISFHFD